MAHTTAVPPKKYIDVLGRRMAYVEMGEGDPIVFLHGNPTSSYLWRDIMPHVAGLGRCIAPDLIGMGDSEKLADSGPGRYRFVEHRRYLEAFLDLLNVTERVTLVVHDWGSALGFDWANRHRGRMHAIAYMEAIVRPMSWDEWPADSRRIFQGFRSEAGEALILERNLFVERVLPGSIQRDLEPEEMEAYRAPFREAGESRRPTLTWPRELPIDDDPSDVVEIVRAYADWMAENDLPKLFVNADPGAILVGPMRDFVRTWPNQTEVTVPGIHFIQEDSAEPIGVALAAWLESLA